MIVYDGFYIHIKKGTEMGENRSFWWCSLQYFGHQVNYLAIPVINLYDVMFVSKINFFLKADAFWAEVKMQYQNDNNLPEDNSGIDMEMSKGTSLVLKPLKFLLFQWWYS